MASETYLKQNNIGPKMGEINAFATSTSSAATNLSTKLGGIATAGDGMCMVSDVNLYFFFGAAGGTADDAATSGDNQTAYLPAGTLFHFRIPQGDAGPQYFLTHKASGAGTIRVWRATDNQ